MYFTTLPGFNIFLGSIPSLVGAGVGMILVILAETLIKGLVKEEFYAQIQNTFIYIV